MGGVNIIDPKHTFIGNNVGFDTNFPGDITIESGVRVTTGCEILTHFMDPKNKVYQRGKVIIKNKAYIGCHSIICKPVTIGEHAIVGAGSVITKDIPAWEVWAGVPAKFIRKIDR